MKVGKIILIVLGSIYLIAGVARLIATPSFFEFITFGGMALLCFWGAKKINDDEKKQKK